MQEYVSTQVFYLEFWSSLAYNYETIAKCNGVMFGGVLHATGFLGTAMFIGCITYRMHPRDLLLLQVSLGMMVLEPCIWYVLSIVI